MQFEKKKEIKKQFANLFYTGSFSSRQYTAYSKPIKSKQKTKYQSEYIFPILPFTKQHEPGTTPDSCRLNSVFPPNPG